MIRARFYHASTLLILAAATTVGCKSAEVSVTYPLTGVRVAAKFEARDPQPSAFEDEEPAPSHTHRKEKASSLWAQGPGDAPA